MAERPAVLHSPSISTWEEGEETRQTKTMQSGRSMRKGHLQHQVRRREEATIIKEKKGAGGV